MPKKEINLIPNRKEDVFRQERALFLARVIASVSLAIVVFTAILLFLLSRDTTLVDVKKQELDITNSLAKMSTKIGANFLIQNRVRQIDTVLKTRLSLEKPIERIQEQMPSDISVNSFSINKNSFSITASAPSLVSIGEFVDNFTLLVNKKDFIKKLTIQGVVANLTAKSYIVSMQADFL